MFSETPFLTRSRGIWVWGLIRSGMKAVGDFRSQNVEIFYEILEENMQKLTVLKNVIAHSFHTAANQPPDPYTPRTGWERSF